MNHRAIQSYLAGVSIMLFIWMLVIIGVRNHEFAAWCGLVALSLFFGMFIFALLYDEGDN